MTFTVGGNFTDDIRGKPYECTTFWDGDKLVFQGLGGNGKITREIVDGGLVATVEIHNEVAKTYFEKQA